MEIKPQISVIMLTYNRERFVSRAIESICNQTLHEFEYIIVDNGSTDNSGIIADCYAKEDSRIRVIHQQRGNIGSGRNVGLDDAKGEFITFIDDDDVADADMLLFLYQLIQKHHAQIAICGSRYYWAKTGEYTNKYIYDELLILNKEQGLYRLLRRDYFNNATPTMLFSRKLFSTVRFNDHGKYDDIASTYKIFAEADLTVAKGVPLYTFTKHETNNSAFIQKNDLSVIQLTEYLQAFTDRTVYLSERVPNLAEYFKYTEWSYMLSMCDKIYMCQIDSCTSIYEKMVSELNKNKPHLINSAYLTKKDKELINKYWGNGIKNQN